MRFSFPVSIPALAIVLSIGLAGCGGDSDNEPGTNPPPVADAKPGGYYTGSVTQSGETFDIEGLVTEDGDAILISEYGIYSTQFDVDGNDFENSFTAYAFDTWDGTNSLLEGTVEGTISERDSIEGTFDFGAESGTLSLDYDADIYEQAATEERITGDWGYTVTNPNYALNITFSSDGSYFGQDSDGCVFQGTWSIPDEDFNAYRLTNGDINCVSADTAWRGVAYIRFDAGSNNDVMVFGLHTDEQAYVDQLNSL